MRRLLTTLVMAIALLLLSATAALANPISAPGAGDSTDVANTTTIAVFGDGSDVPGPYFKGLNNQSLNASPNNASWHAVTNNPACAGHVGH